MENILPEQWKSARIRAVKQKELRMNNAGSSFYMLEVTEAERLLQFPFLVREKGALHCFHRNLASGTCDFNRCGQKERSRYGTWKCHRF